MSDSEESKCHKCPIIVRLMNIASGLLLLGFGIAGLILQTVNNLSGGKFFLLFSPIFMILVGALFIVLQFQCQFIMKRISLMRSFFVRGVFNLFMASSVFYYFSCGNDNDVVGWIAAIMIFLLGVIFIGIHFCGGEQFNFHDNNNNTDRESTGRRQPIM